MNFIIRPEYEKDYFEVESLIRDAFWDQYRPGCVEHLLLHKLRKTQAFIPELDFVAEYGNRLIGSIVYSKAKIMNDEGIAHEAITFGPLGVLPPYQKKGLGSGLVRYTLELAEKMGYQTVVIFGNPDYYHRFGFEDAGRFGISTEDGENFDAFMALKLCSSTTEQISGRFFEDGVFQINENELELFEQNFPSREKHVTDTQFK